MNAREMPDRLAALEPLRSVDVYRVGIGHDLHRLAVDIRTRDPGWASWLRRFPRHAFRSLRRRGMRYYLVCWQAEPDPWPSTPTLSGCGRGWTRTGALLDLARKLEEQAS